MHQIPHSLTIQASRAVARIVAKHVKEEKEEEEVDKHQRDDFMSLIPKDLLTVVMCALSEQGLLQRAFFHQHLVPLFGPHLEQINLSSAQNWLCDSDVNKLLKICPSLKCLDLSHCKLLMAASIHHPQLTHLSLYNCGRKEFNPSIICPQLRSITLFLRNRRIFKKQMAKLEKSAPLLEELFMFGPTDLKVLTFHFEKLRRLSCLKCLSLTASSIRQLLERSECVEHLILDRSLEAEFYFEEEQQEIKITELRPNLQIEFYP